MKEFLVYGNTLPEAYHESLICLNGSEIVPCPDWNTNQKEVSMTFVVEHPLKEDRISRLCYADPMSLEQYVQEMLDGIFDFEVGLGHWSYTYHQRYADQYQFIIDELKRNPYSRRAVMDIRTPDDIGNSDPACWQHAQYFIRGNKLHCKILFRSNDATKAAFMNAYALIELQNRIATTLGVEIGSYTHRANSYHCYERDFSMLAGYCERIKLAEEDEDEITFSYIDDWKEQMAEARPIINKKIEELSARGKPFIDVEKSIP